MMIRVLLAGILLVASGVVAQAWLVQAPSGVVVLCKPLQINGTPPYQINGTPPYQRC